MRGVFDGIGEPKEATMKSKKDARAAPDPAVKVRLPEEMLRALDRLAHEERITRSEVIRRLVKQALAAQQK